jgi:hypothetical protein
MCLRTGLLGCDFVSLGEWPSNLDHLTFEGENKMLPWNIGKPFHPWCSFTCQNTWMLNYTTAKKIWNCSLYLYCIMWVLDTLMYHTVSEFRGCALTVFQRGWDLHESVEQTWRNDCFFESERWRSSVSKTYKLRNILAFHVYTMGHSDNMNLYFSDMYKGHVAVKAFQTKTPLFSKQIKFVYFCTLQPTQMSSSAGCMDSHITL